LLLLLLHSTTSVEATTVSKPGILFLKAAATASTTATTKPIIKTTIIKIAVKATVITKPKVLVSESKAIGGPDWNSKAIKLPKLFLLVRKSWLSERSLLPTSKRSLPLLHPTATLHVATALAASPLLISTFKGEKKGYVKE
jgi:hypothetical protein